MIARCAPSFPTRQTCSPRPLFLARFDASRFQSQEANKNKGLSSAGYIKSQFISIHSIPPRCVWHFIMVFLDRNILLACLLPKCNINIRPGLFVRCASETEPNRAGEATAAGDQRRKSHATLLAPIQPGNHPAILSCWMYISHTQLRASCESRHNCGSSSKTSSRLSSPSARQALTFNTQIMRFCVLPEMGPARRSFAFSFYALLPTHRSSPLHGLSLSRETDSFALLAGEYYDAQLLL